MRPFCLFADAAYGIGDDELLGARRERQDSKSRELPVECGSKTSGRLRRSQ